MESRRCYWAQGLVVGSSVLVTLGFLLLSSSESIQRFEVGPALLLTLWWNSPLVAYVSAVRSSLHAGVIGGAYLVGLTAALASIYGSTSSTAAIGVVVVPLLLWCGMALAIAVSTHPASTGRR